jgi:chromosome segregation ATPase
MEQLKPWFGRLTMGVGLVGVILAVMGPVFLWRTAPEFSARAVEIADLVVNVNDHANKYVGRVENILENMQLTVSELKQSAERMSQDSHRNREVTPLMQKLDEELVRELGEARQLLESIQSGTNVLNQAVKQFDAISSPMRMFNRSAESSDNSDIAVLSQSLVETSKLIQEVIDFVAKIEQQGITDEQAIQFQEAVTRLREELDQGRAHLKSIQAYLQNTCDNVVAKRDKIPVWTNVLATFFTALFVCFGFTQIQLIGFGRSLLAR